MPHISASQIKTANLCVRKWWFTKVLALNTGSQHHFQYGILLHECCERYLNGQDPFPAGWTTCRNDQRFNLLADVDLRQIELSVRKAISKSFIAPEIFQAVEYKFERPVIDGVTLKGVIDWMHPLGVHDHKTTGSDRWALKPAEIVDDLQLLIYARAWLDWEHRGAQEVELRHLYFLKDGSNRVYERRGEKTVSEARILDFWGDEVEGAALYIEGHRGADKWQDLPEPPASACQAFGGCPFREICGGIVTVEQYEGRYART